MMIGEILLCVVLCVLFIPRLIERHRRLPVTPVVVWFVVGALAPLLISSTSSVVTMVLSNMEPSTGLLFFLLFLLVSLLLTTLVWLHLFRPELVRVDPLEYLRRELFIFKKSVKIDWPDSWEAETTKSVVFTFSNSVRPEEVNCSVFCEGEQVNTTEIWSGDTEMEVVFPTQRAGEYKVFLRHGERPVRGSPWLRRVLPSRPHPATSRLVNVSSNTATVVMRAGTSHTVRLDLRDQHNNHIDVTRPHCDVTTVLVDDEACYEVGPCQISKNIEIKFTFSTQSSGAFPASVRYLDDVIGQIQLLVLPPAKINSINNYIAKMGWNSYYEASLLTLQGVSQRSKTVYVYLTDKQMIIREFYLRLIPHRLVSYRVNPQVRLSMADEVLTISQHEEADSLTQLAGDDILLLAATYYTILLRDGSIDFIL